MADENNNLGEKLGEIRGQLRELIHNQNNHAMKQDSIGDKLAKLEGVPDQLDRIDGRLTELEKDRYHRDGAMGLGGWLLKSPAITWLLMAALAVWTYLRNAK